RELERSGELLEHCRRRGQEAVDHSDSLEAQMMTSPNLPKDYMARVRELESIPLIVEEIVLHELIYSL
ncbi:MAG: hypothetical protein AB7U38_08870, partial [Hyphomicrobiales bacterium]